MVDECVLFINGARENGRWRYGDALIAARRHKNAFVWLDLQEPDAEDLAEIAEELQLHHLAVEDAVKAGQRPKVERYGDMTFAAMRTVHYVDHEELTEHSEVVSTGDILLFVGERFVVSVRHGEARALDNLVDRLKGRRSLLAHGPWAVAYAIYDAVVDLFMEAAAGVEEDVATIEESVFSTGRGVPDKHGGHQQPADGHDAHGRIPRIYQLKRELMEFKRAVVPMQRPVTLLAGGHVSTVPGEIRRYFRDVNDHLTRTAEQLTQLDDVLSSVLQARLAQVTVAQNNDMRKIAAWAGIAAVCTAIAGVYGMNFGNMPGLHSPFGFPITMAVMVLASVVLYRAFRRSGWL